jgi:hypothetical protein
MPMDLNVCAAWVCRCGFFFFFFFFFASLRVGATVGIATGNVVMDRKRPLLPKRLFGEIFVLCSRFHPDRTGLSRFV